MLIDFVIIYFARASHSPHNTLTHAPGLTWLWLSSIIIEYQISSLDHWMYDPAEDQLAAAGCKQNIKGHPKNLDSMTRLGANKVKPKVGFKSLVEID